MAKNYIYVSVDVETSGDVPGVFSMLSVGAVAIKKDPVMGEWLMFSEFYTEMSPLPGAQWKEETVQAHGFSFERARAFSPPEVETVRFCDWLDRLANNGENRLIFVSDNPIFDGGFVFYYLFRYCGRCPFGWSGLSMTSIYKGMKKDLRANFRGLRRGVHDHNALTDARGNAVAWITMLKSLKPG